MLTRPFLWTATLALAASIATGSARADIAMPLIRIGDIDGFGYGAAPNFRAANGGLANRDGLGVLGPDDFLPDINRDGATATGRGDEFDFRTGAEIAGRSVFVGNGVTDVATAGSQWTDISLARTYDEAQALGRVLVRNSSGGFGFGPGGDFPDASSNALPNQPSFVFSFLVAKGSVDPLAPIFFNLIFGDYDVVPARIDLTLADGSTRTIGLQTQDNAQREDGLIQAAQADLSFGDVFRDGGANWVGSLRVNFIAPNEPYTSFDFVELSTTPILSVPEPSSVVMLGLGLGAVGLGAWRKARRATSQQ